MALVLGLNAYSAKNIVTVASPVWVVLPGIKDETLNMETSLSDVTTRAGNGWRLQVGTLSEGTIDTSIVYDTADTVTFGYLKDAFLAKTRVLMGFFDADPNAVGTIQGLAGGFSVTNFSINRQLEEAMMVDVQLTAREDDAGNGPAWLNWTNT